MLRASSNKPLTQREVQWWALVNKATVQIGEFSDDHHLKKEDLALW
jgi:hypothetical protein